MGKFGNISSISDEGNVKHGGLSEVGKMEAKKPKMGGDDSSDFIDKIDSLQTKCKVKVCQEAIEEEPLDPPKD